jgi:hypothetical protein
MKWSKGMKIVTKGVNLTGEFVQGFCPTGDEAGELGPYYALLFNVSAPIPEVGLGLTVAMMTGYGARLLQDFVNSIPASLNVESKVIMYVGRDGIVSPETKADSKIGVSPKVEQKAEHHKPESFNP